MTASFKLHCQLDAFSKAGEDGQMYIGGIATTEDLDKDEEVIIQSGLDFDPFLAEGWFNDNHGQKAIDVLGYPTDAQYMAKGAKLPNGKRAEANGWWVEGYLANTDEGRKTWQLCRALSNSPRRLGFSIEGSVTQRDARDQSRITRAVVKHVAITHCPVNTKTEMHALAKALTAGSSIQNPGAAAGEGSPLRQEALNGGLADGAQPAQFDADQLKIGTTHEMEHTDTASIAREIAMDHLKEDPNYYRKLRQMEKAETDSSDFKIIDELDIINEWAPHLSAQLSQMGPPAKLSKSESRIIVRQRFPHLTLDQIDHIIDTAAS